MCLVEQLCHQEMVMPMPVINRGELVCFSHGPQPDSGAAKGLIYLGCHCFDFFRDVFTLQQWTNSVFWLIFSYQSH